MRDLGGAPEHSNAQPDADRSNGNATREPATELALRPATVGSPEVRAAVVVALLTDGMSAKQLPVLSTDAGKAFDDALADEMAQPASKPTVNMDWPFPEEDVGSEFDHDQLREHVRRNFRPLHDCYVRALADEPTLRGDVSLSFDVRPDGRVRGTEIRADTVSDPAVARCMAKAALSWTLPRPTSGRKTRVTLYFALTPGSVDQ